ncbi:MAG: ECF-type sigma factor [Planctomycetota bacterium]
MSDSHDSLERLLAEARAGDDSARNALVERLYDELKVLARAHMRDQPAHASIQSTGLVHEAWVRIFGGRELKAENRAQFFRLASTAMRSVLVDRARARLATKRGGGREREDLEAVDVGVDDGKDAELLQVHELLEQLAEEDPEGVQVAEQCIFGGVSCAEVAAATGVSRRTIERRWRRVSDALRAHLA